MLRSLFCLSRCVYLKGQAVSSPMVPGATAYWVPRVPSPIPPSGKQPMTSSEEDPDERSNAGDQGTAKMFHGSVSKPNEMTATHIVHYLYQEFSKWGPWTPAGVCDP